MSRRTWMRNSSERGRSGYLLRCGVPTCDVVSEPRGLHLGATAAAEQLPQQFEARGWKVGRDARGDRCPRCASIEDDARRRGRVFNPPPLSAVGVVPASGRLTRSERVNPPMSPPAAAKAPTLSMPTKALPVPPIEGTAPRLQAEPPRTMSRDERQLIFRKVDEVYLDERRGYSAGWSDARVARDMGVPVAFVRTVRDENFGPHDADERTLELIAKGPELLAEFEAVKLRMAALETALKPLASLVAKYPKGVAA